MTHRAKGLAVLTALASLSGVARPPIAPEATFASVCTQLGVHDLQNEDAAQEWLHLVRLGRDGAWHRLPSQPSVVDPRGAVLVPHGPSIVEWYSRASAGLEHGVTLKNRLEGSDPLVLEIAMGPELHAVEATRDEVVLTRASGRRVHYGGLAVVDAESRHVGARFALAGDTIHIEIDDASARYPLVVDPVIIDEEDSFTQDSPISVAIDDTGDRTLTGVPSLLIGGLPTGGALVRSRSGTAWSMETTLASGGSSEALYTGASVAISGDGQLAAVGATGAMQGRGQMLLFGRTGTSWTMTAQLTASGDAMNDRFGSSVAIDGSASRIVVGIAQHDEPGATDAGAAIVFLRSGSTFTQEALLVASSAVADARLGGTVAISADGTRVIVGGGYEDSGGSIHNAAAHIWERAGTTWSEVTSLLDGMGGSVAISDDGSRVVIGAPMTSGVGSAIVFELTGASWSEVATLATSTDASNTRFGWSVAISGDGTRILVGAPQAGVGTHAHVGAAQVFDLDAGAWVAGALLSEPTPVTSHQFGRDLALSVDGSRAIVTAIANAPTGAVHTFSLTGRATAPVDAGTDAFVGEDAGASDASVVPAPHAAGCHCHAGAGHSSLGSIAGLAVAALALTRRRR